MWSDNETAIDLLGFQHLISAVTTIIREDALLPATIGVFGDWGSGKSSLLRMIQADLDQDGKETLVLSFNGWLFEGYEDAKTALMGCILDALSERKNLPEKARDLLKKLLRRINWMKVAGATLRHGAALLAAGPAGIAVTTSLDVAARAKGDLEEGSELEFAEAGDYIAEHTGEEMRRAIREFRTDFAQLISESNIKRLIVVIDDLDRCLPDSIIETLEAIRLFLYVPRTAFVIGADERLVKYAVRRRFPELPGDSVEIGAEYLEKLIQFPVRVPPLDASEVETFVNLLFAKRAKLKEGEFEKARLRVVSSEAASLMGVRFNMGVAVEVFESVPEHLKESLGIAERVSPVLAAGLKGNPRQCKRFLNMLAMRLQMARSRSLNLEQRVLAKLMLLEYLKPEWFRRLANLQANAEGRPPVLAGLERAAENSQKPPENDPEATSVTDFKSRKRSRDQPVEKVEEQPAATDSIPADFANWLADKWMRDWVRSEPALGEVDLRPYFYFARDQVGPLGSSVRRMTPAAQELLSKLLHESEAQRKLAVRKAASMSEADAAAIFEALATRASHEDPSASEEALGLLFEWVEARPELRSQMMSLLDRLPPSHMPLSSVPKALNLFKGTDLEDVGRDWLERLAANATKPPLAQAAKRSLERLGS